MRLRPLWQVVSAKNKDPELLYGELPAPLVGRGLEERNASQVLTLWRDAPCREPLVLALLFVVGSTPWQAEGLRKLNAVRTRRIAKVWLHVALSLLAMNAAAVVNVDGDVRKCVAYLSDGWTMSVPTIPFSR